MADHRTDELVEWDPELSPEAWAHYEKLRAEIEPRIIAAIAAKKEREEREANIPPP